MINDTTKFDISFADAPAKSYYTHGLPAVLGFLELALTPPRECLISVQVSRTSDVILSCDGDRVAMFHWDGAVLSAWLGQDSAPQGPMHGLIDQRWMTIYFLPDNAYLKANQAIEAVKQHFEGAPLALIDIPQNTDETIAIYDKLQGDGLIG